MTTLDLVAPAIGYISKATWDTFSADEQFNQVHRVYTAAKHEITYVDGGLNRANWYVKLNNSRNGLGATFFQQYSAIQGVRRSIAAVVERQAVAR